jgi:hypothetical protein
MHPVVYNSLNGYDLRQSYKTVSSENKQDTMMIIIFWEMTPRGSYKMIIIIVTPVETSNLKQDTDYRVNIWLILLLISWLHVSTLIWAILRRI